MHFGENQLSPLSIGISPLPTVHPSGLQSTPVRASTRCYARFTLTMGSSSGFGSTPCDLRPVQTRFRCGSGYCCLNLPQRVTRRIILQKARRHPPRGLRLHVSTRFQVLFHSPRRGPFHRSLTVLCAIGRDAYLALESGLPSFTPDCTCPALLRCQARGRVVLRGRGSHALWRRFPDGFPCTCSAREARQRLFAWSYNPTTATAAALARSWFGPSPVRSPLLRGSFSVPRGT